MNRARLMVELALNKSSTTGVITEHERNSKYQEPSLSINPTLLVHQVTAGNSRNECIHTVESEFDITEQTHEPKEFATLRVLPERPSTRHFYEDSHDRVVQLHDHSFETTDGNIILETTPSVDTTVNFVNQGNDLMIGETNRNRPLNDFSYNEVVSDEEEPFEGSSSDSEYVPSEERN